MSQYEHTQRSPLHLLLLSLAGLFCILAWSAGDPVVRLSLVAATSLLLVLTASFAQLTVYDEEERLVLRYGPLPIFGWQCRLDDVESAQVGRTRWIDGWGIHWIPGRGITFNIWGFDCVILQVKGRTIRIGTDDSHNLAEFITSRIRLWAS